MARKPGGSVRRRADGKWEVRVQRGYRRDGSPRAVSRTAATEAEAEELRARLLMEMGECPTMGDPLTLDEYFERVFLPRVEATTTRANRDFYASAYRTHVSPELGRLDVGSVPQARIAQWCAGLPPASAPAYVRCLRAVLRAAWADGLVAQEPMRQRLRLPRRASRPGDVWGAAEAAECILRVRGEDVEPLVLVMLGAGLSASEARARDWGDFSEGCRAVAVGSAYTQRDGMKEPKGARRWRSAPVLPQCAARLEELRGEGPICVNKRGQRMGPGTTPRRWKALFAEGGALHGMRWIEMNRLRATHETLMQSAGVSDSLNAALHGHSQKVAYSNYLRPAEGALSAAEAAGEALDGAPRLRFA